MRPDGSFNVRRLGSLPMFKDLSAWLMTVSWPVFIGLTLAFLSALLLFFALGYYLLLWQGAPLAGVPSGISEAERFLYCLFFSVQTYTTVGYGSLAPVGLAMNVLSSIEAMLGVLVTTLVTGLLFSRFVMPSAKLLFSRHCLITRYKNSEQHSLQFRFANRRSNVLTNLQVRVMLAMELPTLGPDGQQLYTYQYERLDLEYGKVMFLPLSWTVVHFITPQSPLYGLGLEALQEREAELMIMVTAFDETFQREVHVVHSYYASDFLLDKSFQRPYFVDDEGGYVLDLNKMDDMR